MLKKNHCSLSLPFLKETIHLLYVYFTTEKSKISDVHKSNHTLEVYVESVKVLDLYMMNFPNTSPISLRALKFYQYYFLELWRLAIFRCASVHFKVITFGSSIAPVRREVFLCINLPVSKLSRPNAGNRSNWLSGVCDTT